MHLGWREIQPAVLTQEQRSPEHRDELAARAAVHTQTPDLGKLSQRACDREVVHVLGGQILPQPPLRTGPVLERQTYLRGRGIIPGGEIFRPALFDVRVERSGDNVRIRCIRDDDAIPLRSMEQSDHIDAVPDLTGIGIVDPAIGGDCVSERSLRHTEPAALGLRVDLFVSPAEQAAGLGILAGIILRPLGEALQKLKSRNELPTVDQRLRVLQIDYMGVAPNRINASASFCIAPKCRLSLS